MSTNCQITLKHIVDLTSRPHWTSGQLNPRSQQKDSISWHNYLRSRHNYYVWRPIRSLWRLVKLICWLVFWQADGKSRSLGSDIRRDTKIKWCKHVHLRRCLFLYFNFLECHCWWTKESPRAQIAKFYGRLRLFRSVLRASKFSELKLIEIVILWVYNTIPYGFSLFRHFLDITFQLFKCFVWLRITDEGSVPEMRKWSILKM